MPHHRKWNKELVVDSIKKLEVKLKRRPTKRDDASLYHGSRRLFGGWNNALTRAGFDVKPIQKVLIPENLDSDLSYFIGLLITDGHVCSDISKDRSNYQVKLYTSYSDEKDEIIRLIRRLFHYTATTRGRKYGFNRVTNYEICISSKELVSYLHHKFEIPLGRKSEKVRVPRIFFTENDENLSSFIRGVFDGDGTITGGQFRICSGSRLFLEDIIKLLNKMGVGSGVVRKNSKYEKTFVFSISDKDSLKRLFALLYQKVGFYYLRKRGSYEKLFKQNF